MRHILQNQKQVPFVPFSGIGYIDLLTIAILFGRIVFCRVFAVRTVVFGTPLVASMFVFLSASIRPFVIIVGIEVFDPFRTYHLVHPY